MRAGRQVVVIVEARASATATSRLRTLSPRERDVAELVLQGAPSKRIAGLLDISPWTVRDHLRSIFAKTGVENRHQLMALLLPGPAA